MKLYRFFLLVGFLALQCVIGVVFCIDNQGEILLARLAALKAKTHSVLTSAKDIAPLMNRVDKNLATITQEKKELEKERSSLIARREELLSQLDDMQQKIVSLQKERQQLDYTWNAQLEKLKAFKAQRSIQIEDGACPVDCIKSRDTLLRCVFEVRITSTLVPTVIVAASVVPMGIVEDVRG